MMFSIRLKYLRNEKGLSQQKMADFLGITRQGYGKYEDGKSEPDHKTLVKLAKYFNVTTDYLLGNSDTPNLTQDEETEKILNDPKTNIMFKDWEKMNDQQREEALRFIKFLISNDNE